MNTTCPAHLFGKPTLVLHAWIKDRQNECMGEEIDGQMDGSVEI